MAARWACWIGLHKWEFVLGGPNGEDVLRRCKRCGNVGPKLKKPPFKNAFGQAIFENTCYDCWQLAIRQGTKVINELRLPLNDPQAQSIWDQHIKEFLNLQE